MIIYLSFIFLSPTLKVLLLYLKQACGYIYIHINIWDLNQVAEDFLKFIAAAWQPVNVWSKYVIARMRRHLIARRFIAKSPDISTWMRSAPNIKPHFIYHLIVYCNLSIP